MSSISAGLTTTTGLVYASDSSGNLVLRTNGTTTAVTIDTSQNVGIGTSSPSSILHLSANSPIIKLTNNASNDTPYIQGGTSGAGGDGYLYLSGGSGRGVKLAYNSGTAGVTLDGNGNFGIGNTSPGSAFGGFIYQPAYTTTGNGAWAVNHVSGSASGSPYGIFTYNSTQIGSITQSGTTAVLYNVTSDQRLKENIVDAPDASADIDAIKIRSFDFISDKSSVKYGFIAQELVTVAPDAVHQPSNPDDMMGVDYSKLVPMMLKEIQSLRARLKAANIA